MSASSGRSLTAEARPCTATGRHTKVLDAEEAARLILDGDTLAPGGFVGMAVPEGLSAAVGERFDRRLGQTDGGDSLVVECGGFDLSRPGATRFLGLLPERERCRSWAW